MIIIMILVGFLLYPLFDMIYCKLISNTTFVYSVNKHVVQPIIFAVIYSLVYWSVDRKNI